MSSIIALIPARSGSKRIKNKNIRSLCDYPLIYYTIRCAQESKIFDHVFCITDSIEYSKIAEKYGAKVPELRPKSTSKDNSPDIEWVKWSLSLLDRLKYKFEAFAILRPTSPLRKPQDIKKAWKLLKSNPTADSVRAVRLSKEHPGKQWVMKNDNLFPILPFTKNGTPWHSHQYNNLPVVYTQTASLEIIWKKTVLNKKSISGDIIKGILIDDISNLDINYEEDLKIAEYYLKNEY